MKSNLLKKLEKAIIEFDTNTAEDVIRQAMKEEFKPSDILKAVSNGLDKVGELYESREYFISELMLAGDTAKTVINLLNPYIKETKTQMFGIIVFGTVKEDIHDIGKTIISSFMVGAGFMVHDIGVGVSEKKFVEAIRQYNPDILAMSTLLNNTKEYMKNVITAVKQAGLRNNIKIIIGGRPITPEYAKLIGADATAINPIDAVEICKKWMKKI